jgi:hypothetical protein
LFQTSIQIVDRLGVLTCVYRSFNMLKSRSRKPMVAEFSLWL